MDTDETQVTDILACPTPAAPAPCDIDKSLSADALRDQHQHATAEASQPMEPAHHEPIPAVAMLKLLLLICHRLAQFFHRM